MSLAFMIGAGLTKQAGRLFRPLNDPSRYGGGAAVGGGSAAGAPDPFGRDKPRVADLAMNSNLPEYTPSWQQYRRPVSQQEIMANRRGLFDRAPDGDDPTAKLIASPWRTAVLGDGRVLDDVKSSLPGLMIGGPMGALATALWGRFSRAGANERKITRQMSRMPENATVQDYQAEQIALANRKAQAQEAARRAQAEATRHQGAATLRDF